MPRAISSGGHEAARRLEPESIRPLPPANTNSTAAATAAADSAAASDSALGKCPGRAHGLDINDGTPPAAPAGRINLPLPSRASKRSARSPKSSSTRTGENEKKSRRPFQCLPLPFSFFFFSSFFFYFIFGCRKIVGVTGD